MKSREFESLIRRHLLDSLPGYATKGYLLFAAPIRDVLRGYCFEGSGFDRTAFTVSAFAQPLYVPEKNIVLTLGKRLGAIRGGPERWWTITKETESVVMAQVLSGIKDEGEGLIRMINAPGALLQNLDKLTGDLSNPHVLEARAYSHLLLGEVADAVTCLEILESTLDRSVPWQGEMVERARRVRSTLGKAAGATRMLLQMWADQTGQNLKLSHYRQIEDGT